MRSCIFFSVADMSIWRSTFIIARLSARPFLGSVDKAAAPPVCILPILPRSVSAHYFLFLQVVSQHLGLSDKPWGFGSDLEGSTFGFWCPPFSRGGSKVARNFSFVLPAFYGGGRFLIYLAYQLWNIWTFNWGLCYWGSFLGWLSPMKSAKAIGEYFHSFPCDLDWIFSSAWSTDHVRGLRPCRRVAPLLRSSNGGPFFSGGIQISRQDCFYLMSVSP